MIEMRQAEWIYRHDKNTLTLWAAYSVKYTLQCTFIGEVAVADHRHETSPINNIAAYFYALHIRTVLGAPGET
jgi:hypothetical protein